MIHTADVWLQYLGGVWYLSFSLAVKNELCRLENSDHCCMTSELAAAVRINGAAVVTGDGDVNLKITTENAAFARRVYTQIKKSCGIFPEVIIRKSKRLKKHASYILVITSNLGSGRLLQNLGIGIGEAAPEASTELVFLKKNSLRKVCCRKAFLRGAFLAGGSVSDPEKTYHLEITTHSYKMAQDLSRVLETFKLNARIIRRKGSYVTYLKEGENIVDFLNIIGAHSALMELENVRILKGMRNNVNRIVNCETANLEKTVNASLRQVENIKYLMEKTGFSELPDNLREMAELRLAYSDASLAELGQMMHPVLGKSGVNHRLRKLDRIAEDERKIRGEN